MKPPKKLSDKAKQVWNDIEERSSRKLNELDYVIIEQFCNEMDLYDEAVREIQEKGFENAHNQVAPAVSVRNGASNNLRQLYKVIGDFLGDAKKDTPLRSIKNF